MFQFIRTILQFYPISLPGEGMRPRIRVVTIPLHSDHSFELSGRCISSLIFLPNSSILGFRTSRTSLVKSDLWFLLSRARKDDSHAHRSAGTKSVPPTCTFTSTLVSGHGKTCVCAGTHDKCISSLSSSLCGLSWMT
ncbi:unnamed protein product [Periconia digitata]|uniref:Uncharacterized protein n=1 Tax=Periconia digitata TaxID=1303443 RepID=A0A9W4UIB0_9PLEO|nr:unnamed protein product [Periconia digitata]